MFVVSVVIWAHFDKSQADFQFVEESPWLGPIKYKLGVDGISVLFVVLTAFLMPLCILASWTSVTDRVKEYIIPFLRLGPLLSGFFCSPYLPLCYLFFQ